MSSVLMTAKVCINDLWIDLSSLLSRGTLVDFVQDTISCGTQSEVGAKQLKSAEIQEITEVSQVVFMKLARIFFALLLGCWCVIASRAGTLWRWRTARADFFFFFFLPSVLQTWALDLPGLFVQAAWRTRGSSARCYARKPSANSKMTFMSCQFLLICGAFRTYLFLHTDWARCCLAAPVHQWTRRKRSRVTCVRRVLKDRLVGVCSRTVDQD